MTAEADGAARRATAKPGGHLPGGTTGTAERAPRHLAGTVSTFDLAREVARLRDERAWQTSGRNAKTLVKEGAFTVVLVVLRGGVRIMEHHATGRIALQSCAGHLRVDLAGESIDLPSGALVCLEHAPPYAVEALEDSAFLLTLGRQEMEREGQAPPNPLGLPEPGARGITVGALTPAGVIRVEGQLWSARLLGGLLAPGVPVRVRAREGLMLVVAPIDDAGPQEREFPDVAS